MIPANIKNTLLKQFNIEDADLQTQQKFLGTFEDFSQQVATDFILGVLDVNDRAIFLDTLIEEESGQKALAFAKGQIPDLDLKLQKRMQEEIALLNTPVK